MISRPEIHAVIRLFLEGPAPALLHLHGFPGSGKTTLLAEALSDHPAVFLRGSRLPAPLAAREMEASLQGQLGEAPGETVRGDGPWTRVVHRLMRAAEVDHPPILVLDDADNLLADRRFVRAFEEFWTHLRGHGLRQHLVVSTRGATLPDGWSLPESEAPAQGKPSLPEGPRVRIGPLRLREVAEAVPRWRSGELVALYARVGGIPGFWGRVDPARSPGWNLSRLLLAPDAPARGLPEALLPPGLRENERSLALVHALAHGAVSWGELRDEAAVFRSSSELGPYVKGLVEGGVLEVSRSLDASPRGRNRRYRLVHPLLALWHGAIRPRLSELDAGAPVERVLVDVETRTGNLVAATLPGILREYLLHHGEERLPARAREVGAAWGEGYDVEVAGTLQSGAAVYGRVIWSDPSPPPDTLDRLGEEIRQARYGFSREARLRLLLLPGDPPHDLARRAAQLPGTYLLGPGDLVGRG